MQTCDHHVIIFDTDNGSMKDNLKGKIRLKKMHTL